MNLNNEDRELLINNYLEKARTTIEKVEFLVDNNEYQLAVNRIYYGIYYSLSALAIRHRYSTSKHAQLIGWFNRTFVKAGGIEKSFSKIIRKAFENRMEGDYNVFADFSKEEVEESLKEMKIVIQALDKLIKE
ncbi:MAG: HEPN domain-containing protein [Deltaproteobacteria bacterium]|jgi:uncharacterized protein (UPF0332 family)|nr:HEPN domain-containing protein [Deltaproteobacteria bacterium]